MLGYLILLKALEVPPESIMFRYSNKPLFVLLTDADCR